MAFLAASMACGILGWTLLAVVWFSSTPGALVVVVGTSLLNDALGPWFWDLLDVVKTGLRCTVAMVLSSAGCLRIWDCSCTASR